MSRLLFEKTGNAVWISHLDLMRLFQRAFKRAGLLLKHTQGFNPRPSVSIALPLSVGVQSQCELLDFELEGEQPDGEQIRQRLNAALVEGVRVIDVYENGRKLRDLALLSCYIDLEYDGGVTDETVARIKGLFEQPAVTVTKKGKNGPIEQDIIPMIKNLTVAAADACTVRMNALICCQNPSLNPMQIVAAVERYLPNDKPDHAVCGRIALFDTNEKIFR